MSYTSELIQVAAVACAALEDVYIENGMHPGNARVEVLSFIMEERAKQIEKWGEQKHDPMKWFTILGEEVGEVANAILEKDFN